MTLSEWMQNVRRQPWDLWSRQARAVVSIDLRRRLFSRRALGVFLLAFAPAAIILLHAIFDRRMPHGDSHLREDTTAMAGIFQFYYLRVGIFFGALAIFTRLIRGEMIERSLHYFLLAPVRREVLLVGKFLAGAVTVLLLFESAVFICFAAMYGHLGATGYDFVFDGPGLRHLGAYLGATALACLGYGAVFLLLGMLLKNPAPAALLVMGWEALNPIMPPLLQKISVASYIRHLIPVSVKAEGVFALLTVVTEPVAPWIATLGVIALTTAVVAISATMMRRLEINYTSE